MRKIETMTQNKSDSALLELEEQKQKIQKLSEKIKSQNSELTKLKEEYIGSGNENVNNLVNKINSIQEV